MVCLKIIATNLLLVTFAVGIPHSPHTSADSLEERAVNCKAVNGALLVLKVLGPPATSFCLRYLNVPATTTLHATATTRTTTFTTDKVTITEAQATVVVTTSTRSIRSIQSSCPNVPRGIEMIKREPIEEVEKRQNIDIPALKAFAAAQLSSGCACLSVGPTATRTLTSTATQTDVQTVTEKAVITPEPTTQYTAFTTTYCTTCNANGQPCDFFDPGACCGRWCSQYAGGGPVTATCWSPQ